MKKQISMSSYIEKLRDEMTEAGPLDFEQTKGYFDKVFNFSSFIRQKPKLWMFVPVSLFGDVLELPVKKRGETATYAQEIQYYEAAKARIIYANFEIKKLDKDTKHITNGVVSIAWYTKETDWYFSAGIKTLEDLSNFNLDFVENFCEKTIENLLKK
jgi:hypothetical protein